MLKPFIASTAVVLVGLSSLIVLAETPTATTGTASKQHLFRTSTIESLHVRNSAGDDLGKIKDIVIDARTGKVTYAALDFGGYLGIGDKLFAVPWHAFQYRQTGDDEFLLLDVPKDRLKEAPGFDKSDWPDMANPQWSTTVDKFYDPHSRAG